MRVGSAFDTAEFMHEAGAVALNWGEAAAWRRGPRLMVCSRLMPQDIRQVSVWTLPLILNRIRPELLRLLADARFRQGAGARGRAAPLNDWVHPSKRKGASTDLLQTTGKVQHQIGKTINEHQPKKL